ncbi:MAG: 2-amino-4-hydroxy-6-hydroxymethyldihydropteridine diphosphokinase [Bacteriovoracaceae bacterium]|jgi:2-amino-4-hydroxy-6-hydroxymethyldihydropteridine diphosphokinase|nr:2-amino-4-hydroxy-6-hydroxymethyldihydropteridine diphosphokinase [Bacteriovoracaceae bacterium]
MSLVLALGSNLGDRMQNLKNAMLELSKDFDLIKVSSIYESVPVDYLDQPLFLNCVAEFKLPNYDPEQVLDMVNAIENKLGRQRQIDKGPRTIDIDIIFLDDLTIDLPRLKVPHPRWRERSFVVLPLKELPFYSNLARMVDVPKSFEKGSQIYSPE